MAGPRDKRNAEASQAGDAPHQPKRRLGGPLGPLSLEVSARSAGCVHTKEIAAYDVVHNLRSGRRVLVLNTNKPGPLEFRKGEKPVYHESWKLPACVKVALEHYNRLNEDVHELVKAVDSYVFLYNGEWMHVNFLAKSKQGVPKSFFAELKIEGKKKISCAICTEMDPDDPKTAPFRGGCEACPGRIFHPAAGGYLGAKPGAGGDLGTKSGAGGDLGTKSGAGDLEACGKAASLFNVDAMASA